MTIVKNLNLGASIMHFVLAIGFAIYFGIINNKYANQPIQGVELSVRDHSISISKTICSPPDVGACDATGHKLIGQWNSVETGTLDIKVLQGMLISFFLITGSFHLFYYLSDNQVEKDANGKDIEQWDNKYTRMISNSNNYFRWIEYSITSTLMLYIIALTSGVKDTNIYMTLFATNVAMIYTGQIVEEYVRDGKNWVIPMVLGFVLLISEFVVIIRAFWARLAEVNSYINANQSDPLVAGKSIPSWLNYMIIVLFIFFSCFGFVSIWGAVANVKYEFIERWYIILSFVAKATLGVFIAYGTGQRQKGWKNS